MLYKEGFTFFQNRQAVDWSYNEYADPSFQFYDQTLIDKIQLGDEKIAEFFRLIAINHTVMPDYDADGKNNLHIRDMIMI